MYINNDEHGNVVLISLYVDDLIIMGSSIELIDAIKTTLSQTFEMKDLGKMHYCLGIEMWKENGRTLTTQSKYAKKLIQNFNMQDFKAPCTPLEQNIKFSCDSDTSEVNETLYREMVRSLNYLIMTRLNISHFVSVLSHFMPTPLKVHWNAKKRVLQFLQGNISFGIEYANHLNIELTNYSNFDWEGNPDDFKSTTSYVFNIELCFVSWSSKKQTTISFSSIETEYKALCSATYEVIWLRRTLADMGQKQEGPTSIKCDNQSTIKLVSNSIYHARSKHIEIQHHFVRERI